MSSADKNLSEYNSDNIGDVEDIRIGIVVSEWNREITGGLLRGAEETLSKHGVKSDQIVVQWVPGSYELPFGAQVMLEAMPLDAVICLGCVIRGETAHFDFVCQACAQGVKDVGLKYSKPVIFGVLTDDNIEQSRARSGGQLGNKGIEAASAALQLYTMKKNLSGDQGQGLGFGR